MVKMLAHLLGDPTPDLLVLCGLVVLAVGIGRKPDGKRTWDRARSMLLSLIACLFVALGFMVHSNHGLTASSDGLNSAASPNSSAMPLDPDTSTFSSAAVDQYLGKLSDPPAYYGQVQVSIATFLGTWTNLEPAEDHEIHRLRIVEEGNQPLVHAWGMCRPSDCNWGELQAALSEGEVSVTFKTGKRARRVVLTPMPSGELQVETVEKSPGLPDHGSESFFARRH